MEQRDRSWDASYIYCFVLFVLNSPNRFTWTVLAGSERSCWGLLKDSFLILFFLIYLLPLHYPGLGFFS